MTDTANPEANAAHGLDKPRLVVTLTLTGGARMTLTASLHQDGDEKKAYARRAEATFIAEVPEAIFKDLDVKPADLRDKSLITFERDKVAKVSFVLGEEPITLERARAQGDAGRADDWTITLPTPGRARKWKMNSVLWGLSSLKATEIVEEKAANLSKYGLDKPRRTVTLFDDSGRELGTVAFGETKDNKVYAQNKAEPKVFEVDKVRMSELPSSRTNLEEPKPAPDGGPAK